MLLECVSSHIQFEGQQFSPGEVKLVAKNTVHTVNIRYGNLQYIQYVHISRPLTTFTSTFLGIACHRPFLG